MYGTCQTLMLQIIGFHSLEGPTALYDNYGHPSNLWVTGTHIYGMVVIIANIKVWNSTSNHTFLSNLIIFGSIASFYLMVFIENKLKFVYHLHGLFIYAMRMPQFYFMCFFFILSTAFTEKLLYWSNLYMSEQKEKRQERDEILLKYRRAQESNMIRRGHVRHTGFALSGEEGGGSQINRVMVNGTSPSKESKSGQKKQMSHIYEQEEEEKDSREMYEM